jgi:hypothetical protein
MVTFKEIEIARRDAYDAAVAKVSEFQSARREAKSWHPLGTRERHNQDLSYRRTERRLLAAALEARIAYAAVCALHGGHHTVPLRNGLHRRYPDTVSALQGMREEFGGSIVARGGNERW